MDGLHIRVIFRSVTQTVSSVLAERSSFTIQAVAMRLDISTVVVTALHLSPQSLACT